MAETPAYRFSEPQRRAINALRCMRCGHSLKQQGSSLRCVHCDQEVRILEDGILDTMTDPGRLTPAQRAGQWGFVARWYDRLWRGKALTLLSGRQFPPDEEHRRVRNIIDPGPHALILDNACANGYYGRALARVLQNVGGNGAIIANDLSLPMLRAAHRLASAEGVAERMLFIRSDSEQMPFSSATLDGAVCGGTLNEFQNPSRVLEELARVLKPQGRTSMMFQTASPHPVGRILKGFLGRISGLRFWTIHQALELFRPRFDSTVSLHEGSVSLVRLDPKGRAHRKRSKKRKPHVRSRRSAYPKAAARSSKG